MLGDSSVRIWNMNTPQKPVNQWVAHETAEVLSADWCKYDQVRHKQCTPSLDKSISVTETVC